MATITVKHIESARINSCYYYQYVLHNRHVIAFSLLEYNCFTMLCWFLLYTEVNQLYVYIYPFPLGSPSHPPPPSHPSIQVITEHRAELPVLYSRFPLAIYFTHGSVFMSDLITQFIPPSPCTGVHMSLLYVCLYSYPTNRLICTIFLDSTYMR